MNPEYTHLPRTREAAKAAGVKMFYTGEPCARGHDAPRYASSSRKCRACAIEDSTRYVGRLEVEAERKQWIHIKADWTPVVVLLPGRLP